LISPRQPVSPARHVELTITSHAGSLAVVRSTLSRMAQLEGFAPEVVDRITLALDEALANVIKHGYQGSPDQPIHITLEGIKGSDGRRGLQISVRDHGKQVDPTTIRGRELSDVRPGGLGVHIMRSIMDSVEYSRPPDGGMLLRMVKYRPAQPADTGEKQG
jgi:anti-sigma regulatory factor (Ser/Thr protein kinase)